MLPVPLRVGTEWLGVSLAPPVVDWDAYWVDAGPAIVDKGANRVGAGGWSAAGPVSRTQDGTFAQNRFWQAGQLPPHSGSRAPPRSPVDHCLGILCRQSGPCHGVQNTRVPTGSRFGDSHPSSP